MNKGTREAVKQVEFPLGVLLRPALSYTEEKVAFCPLQDNPHEVSAYVPSRDN